MKQTSLSVLILFAILNSTAFCQHSVTFFGMMSYNSYSMGDLEGIQNELLNDMNDLNIPTEITESFPAYFGYEFGFLIPVIDTAGNIFSIGGFIEHGSTGGRIHYQDYSGEVGSDQFAVETSIGTMIDYQIKLDEYFNIGLNFAIGYTVSSFSVTSYLQIGEESAEDELNFSSYSFSFEPGIVPSMNLLGMQFGISLSYLVYIPSNLEFDGYSEAYLINKSGDKVNINWSGFRLGLLLSVSL
jgi:hypothetical protein